MFSFKCFVNNFVMKKFYVKFMSIFLIAIFSFGVFSGCARQGVSHQITHYPTKLVYQVGETPNFDGLKVETINNDGTHTMLRFSKEDISAVDTSTPGTKKVEVTKGDMSVAFNIYVANVVVNDSDDVKSIFESLNDGDIVYLREGEYSPQNASDTRYKDIIINKSITLVGDGINKTKFFGNFIVGANFDGSVFTKIDNFEDVKFLNIGFKLDYEIKNKIVTYSGPYGSTNSNGAIRCFDTKKMLISGCSFDGYGYGILADNVSGYTITNSMFKNIFHNAIMITTDISNSSINKNIFIDVAKNVVAFENNTQSWLGAIYLNFATEGERGVIISKNNFNRIGIHNAEIVFFDDASKQKASNTTNNLFRGSYINNSAAIILLSSSEDDLEISGIILSNNNYSGTFESIYMGAKSANTINQSGVFIVE